MEEFKELLPLIGALFNPGLRERHWMKMSELAGRDLMPTEVCPTIQGTIQGILKIKKH